MSSWLEFFTYYRDDPEGGLVALEAWYSGIRGRTRPDLTPYNEYFWNEAEARAGWHVWRLLRGTPDAPFPGDQKRGYEGRPDGLSLFQRGTNGGMAT